MSKINSVLSGAILTIMRNAASNLIETRTARTQMTMRTTKTRVRGIEPVIGKEKKAPATPKTPQIASAEKLSESVSLNFNDVRNDINCDRASNSKSNVPLKAKVSFVDVSGTVFGAAKYQRRQHSQKFSKKLNHLNQYLGTVNRNAHKPVPSMYGGLSKQSTYRVDQVSQQIKEIHK